MSDTFGDYYYKFYKKMIEKKLGRELTFYDSQFLADFADINTVSPSKVAFYHARYCLIRLYPLFIIRMSIRNKVKVALAYDDAISPCLRSCYREIADMILFFAIRAHVKSSSNDSK